MTLLVLAHDGDQTAEAIAAHARRSGIGVIVSDRSDLSLTLQSERDGGCATTILRSNAPVPVSAILNRMHGPHDEEGESRFRAAEMLAAWWALLAEFPGPVINRPSRHRFLPELDATALAKRAALPCAKRLLATRSFVPGPCNVHRLHDGSYVGFFANECNHPVHGDEVWCYTNFDPSCAVYAIISGTQMIQVGDPNARLVEPLERLRSAVLAEGVNFAYLVLSLTDVLTLVHASAFPVIGSYRGQEQAVHQALFEFLAAV